MVDLYSLIWNDRFWLPYPYTWKDLESSDGIYYPKIGDITLPSLVLGLVLLVIREVWYRYIAHPIGVYYGLKWRTLKRAESQPALESFYGNNKKLNTSTLKIIEKKTGLSIKYIEAWFRRRNKDDAPTEMKKFQEFSWQFIFYLCAFIYGLVILWNKPWFWLADIRTVWKDYPHSISNDVYWYYLIELAFYWSMCFSIMFDIKRKDFLQMIIHHVATIFLIYFSWVGDFVPYGSLVILVHDAVDYWLAAAKMAKYCKKQMLCEILFYCFFAVWCITRLGIYPFSLLYSATFTIAEFMPPFGSHRCFQVLLYTLQILHLIWTYMILKIAVQKFTRGNLEKDSRSDSESDNSTESESEYQEKHANHVTT